MSDMADSVAATTTATTTLTASDEAGPSRLPPHPASKRTPSGPTNLFVQRARSLAATDQTPPSTPTPSSPRVRTCATPSISRPSTPSASQQPGPAHDTGTYEQDGRLYERQSRKCQAPRYSQWTKCSACVAKARWDTCRFIGIRVFPLHTDTLAPYSPSEPDVTLEHAPFLAEDDLFDSVRFDYPIAQDVFPPAEQQTTAALDAVAVQALVPLLQQELDHASLPNTLKRRPEVEYRQQCDACLTSLFSASYICRRCGKEYCLDCADELRCGGAGDGSQGGQTTSESNGAPPLLTTLTRCSVRAAHSAADLCPLTRLDVDGLRSQVEQMREIAAAQSTAGPARTPPSHPRLPTVDAVRDKYRGVHLAGPFVDEEIGSHDIARFDALDEETFRAEWEKGDPIVVHGCLEPPTAPDWWNSRGDGIGGSGAMDVDGDGSSPEQGAASRAQDVEVDVDGQEGKGEQATTASRACPPQSASWGPWSFCTEQYRRENCLIERCDGKAHGERRDITVSRFFHTFGQSRSAKLRAFGGDDGIWKLKDWPPSADFKHDFPDLDAHFNACLPAPAYTRRDGRMNISAYFPRNALATDLGPKMYNAWASVENEESYGSTKLHMDVADAVNLMYYAAKPADDGGDDQGDGAGVAAWDIFPAEDADAIRDYIRATRPLGDSPDPIHTQSHFLTPFDRLALWHTRGVRSWRIYQRPGDAIFIPAGCAHQVCNLADCIKVAVDFVSPQNVARCLQLTREFRGMKSEKSKAWKEDVLQLKSMLWHAWCAGRAMRWGGDVVEGEGAAAGEAGAEADGVANVETDAVTPAPAYKPLPTRRDTGVLPAPPAAAAAATPQRAPSRRARRGSSSSSSQQPPQQQSTSQRATRRARQSGGSSALRREAQESDVDADADEEDGRDAEGGAVQNGRTEDEDEDGSAPSQPRPPRRKRARREAEEPPTEGVSSARRRVRRGVGARRAVAGANPDEDSESSSDLSSPADCSEAEARAESGTASRRPLRPLHERRASAGANGRLCPRTPSSRSTSTSPPRDGLDGGSTTTPTPTLSAKGAPTAAAAAKGKARARSKVRARA